MSVIKINKENFASEVRQRNTVTGTLTEASTYLLIEFLPLRISSRTKAHRFMCIV